MLKTEVSMHDKDGTLTNEAVQNAYYESRAAVLGISVEKVREQAAKRGEREQRAAGIRAGDIEPVTRVPFEQDLRRIETGGAPVTFGNVPLPSTADAAAPAASVSYGQAALNPDGTLKVETIAHADGEIAAHGISAGDGETKTVEVKAQANDALTNFLSQSASAENAPEPKTAGDAGEQTGTPATVQGNGGTLEAGTSGEFTTATLKEGVQSAPVSNTVVSENDLRQLETGTATVSPIGAATVDSGTPQTSEQQNAQLERQNAQAMNTQTADAGNTTATDTTQPPPNGE